MAGDVIQNIVGAFGRYQFLLCILIFPTKFLISFHQMAIIFLAPRVEFECPDQENPCPCTNPKYDTTIFTNTIATQWNLICEKRWLVSFTQTTFQLGVLVGSILFGMAADRYGRKKPLLLACMMQLVAGVGAAFVGNYWVFTILRMIVGASVGGTMVTSFVIIMEFIGAEYRPVISACYQLPFNLGHMLLAVYSYFLRDFRHYQMGISLPALYFLLYFFFCPETPRWLVAAKKTDEAVRVVEHAAKINNLPTDNIRSDMAAYQASLEKSNLKKGTLIDLFRTPNLRKNIIAMSINWMACSYCFYGVSQYVGQLAGNVFANVLASASVAFCGTLLSIPLMRVIGRRTILIVFHFLSAGCLVLLAFIPPGVASVALASVGVVSSFIVFVVVYLYCSELFPTVVRNAALGFSSMTARIGSMIAPFVIDLQIIASWMPPIGFASLPFIAGCVTFLLPETRGCELTNTLEEGEAFGKKPTPTSR